jgi:hypothetical protein
MLHLFLRARRDAQPYGNHWLDGFPVRSIKTREVMDSESPARIRRTRHERIPATICRECTVRSVTGEQGGFRIKFEGWQSSSRSRFSATIIMAHNSSQRLSSRPM